MPTPSDRQIDAEMQQHPETVGVLEAMSAERNRQEEIWLNQHAQEPDVIALADRWGFLSLNKDQGEVLDLLTRGF